MMKSACRTGVFYAKAAKKRLTILHDKSLK